MAERGYAPAFTIQTSCDQGDDMNAGFVLPDGTAVSCDFREDPATRQAVRITRWYVYESSTTEDAALAAEILADARLREAFDRAVLAFFDFHWRDIDRPLSTE